VSATSKEQINGELTDMIAIDIMCRSLGKTSFANLSVPGKRGPETNPIKAVETAFSTLEWTNQMRRFITSMHPELVIRF
jgi:hypothetical protein